MAESTDPLTRAIELSLEFETLRGTKSVEEFLRDHEGLRDILEPLLTPDTGPDDRQILGDFELRRELGRGGMGVVYEAVQILLGRTVALKLLPPHRALSPRSLAMFRREATLAASLDHPGIAKVLEFQEVDGQLALAMELIHGVPLDDVEAPMQGRVPADLTAADLAIHAKVNVGDPSTPHSFSGGYVEACVELVRQVAEALDHAHKRGIVHRDVKPGNILITGQGRAVLTDFGLAREEGMPGMTRTGEFAGTHQYAAPEQLAGRVGEIDGRTDIYALGATLYELITLRRPLEAESLTEHLQRIEREEPIRPTRLNPRISADLESVTLCALEKNRHLRYASAEEFATDLQHVLLNTPVRARRLSTSIRATRWIRRNKLVTTFVTFLVTAVTTISLFAASTSQAKDREKTARERWENIWVGASMDAVKGRAEEAIPAWPEQLDELRALSHTIEHDLLPRQRDHRVALDHLRSGHMLDQPGPRSEMRPNHPASAKILALQGVIHRLTIDSRALPDSHPVYKETAAEIANMQSEVAELSELVATSNRVHIEDPKDSALHDRLEDQLFRMRHLHTVLLPDLRSRIDWAQRVQEDTTVRPHAAWSAAAARVAADARFAGTVLHPQIGLIPLGPDPSSRLEEFGHPASGEVPTRGADNTLEIRVEHGVVFTLMPGGQFTPSSRRGSRDIKLAPFFASKFEMSRAQWQRLSNNLPGLRWRDGGIADVRNHSQMFKPVNGISWNMCRRLLDRHGLDMPTTAQWHYLGTFGGGIGERQLRLFSNRRDQRFAKARRADPATCVDYDDGHVGLAPIASMAAVPAGLHHLHGNVGEWCRDPYLGLTSPPRDGDGLRATAATHNAQRVVCGSDFNSTTRPLLLFDRRSPNSSARTIGVRPIRRVF